MTRMLAAVVALAGMGAPLAAQMATADRVAAPGWWPTTRTSSRGDYIGVSACLECHPTRATQQATPMARTASRAAESPVLLAPTRLQLDAGGYEYSIERDAGRPMYSVTRGGERRSAPLAWAIGAGTVGQTFLFEFEGRLHEARVSYYNSVGRLGFTPARALANPRDVAEAMARPVNESEARRCFGCHTTASSTREGFDLARMTPGVTCEACHGPGRAHRAAVEREGAAKGRGTIMNPSTLAAGDSIDFCGACHATFWDVTLANERGLAALRSQPYRLQSSRCWSGSTSTRRLAGGAGQADDRLTCVACHDPHKPLARDPASYDRNCLGCHATRGAAPHGVRPGRACPVGTTACAACHMPKYDVPEMHAQFTDHRIRVAVTSTNRQ